MRILSDFICGCDPGRQGAFVTIQVSTGKIINKNIMPVKSKGLDLDQMVNLILDINQVEPWFFVEDIHSIFGTGKGSMFTMGRGLGNIEGVLSALGCTYYMIQAKIWQKATILPEDIVLKDPTAKRKVRDTKATALKAVRRLYPDVDLCYGDNERQGNRRSKFHSGITDALLIAHSQL